MSYDLVGEDYLVGEDEIGDDIEGAIGAELDELIGADPDADLLHALAVSGAGNTDIIGAVRKARARRANPKTARLAQLAARNAGAVVSRGLEKRRRYPLGFTVTTIAAAATSQIPSAPQNLFRAERLVVPSDIAFDLGIVDIKVGNQSQFVQAVEIPAAIFTEVSIYTGVMFDTAEVGNQISVQARNKSGASVDFTAAALGTIAK